MRPDNKPAWWREYLVQFIVGSAVAIVGAIAAFVLTQRGAEPPVPPPHSSPGPVATVPPAEESPIAPEPSASASPREGLLELGSVTSEWRPQPGQQHRSSGDFSTEGLPGGTTALYWEVMGAPNDRASFDVMENVPFGFDPIVFRGVMNGSRTHVYESRGLYIANPQGSGEQNFTVRVYAVRLQ